MPKFRKKPVEIDAVKWDGDQGTYDMIETWTDHRVRDWPGTDNDLLIPTLEGDMRAGLGDYVIKDIAGEVYPCKPDIFAATYEPA